MEITTTPVSKASLWTGRILSGLVIVFLLFDAIMKIIREEHSIKGSVDLGWPDAAIQGTGIVLLMCTIIYCIPRTAILGAILLTGYLGGAMAIMISAGQQFWFALTFGVLVWTGLYLRNNGLRLIIPFQR